MQSLQNWLGGGAPDREPAAGGSVLSDWKQYSGSGGSAAAAPSANQGDRLLAAEEGAAGTSAGAVGAAASGEWAGKGLRLERLRGAGA